MNFFERGSARSEIQFTAHPAVQVRDSLGEMNLVMHSRSAAVLTVSVWLVGCHDPVPAEETMGTDDTASTLDSTGNVDTSSESTGQPETTGDTDTSTDPPQSGCGQEIVGSGTVSGFNTLILMIGDDEYKVQTNPWGGADQTISVGDGKVFSVDFITHPAGAEDWEVASFPSVYRGMPYGGDATADSGLPIAIADINGVETGIKTNATETSYQGNATYDVYFTNSESYSGGAPDVYLMVWLDAKGLNPINQPGEGWDCGGQAPNFIDACSGAGSANIAGDTFYRFVGPNGSSTVITYVPANRRSDFEFDLNDFIQDAVGHGVLSPSMYLQGVQAGFELADAGAGLTIDEFCVDLW